MNDKKMQKALSGAIFVEVSKEEYEQFTSNRVICYATCVGEMNYRDTKSGETFSFPCTVCYAMSVIGSKCYGKTVSRDDGVKYFCNAALKDERTPDSVKALNIISDDNGAEQSDTVDLVAKKDKDNQVEQPEHDKPDSEQTTSNRQFVGPFEGPIERRIAYCMMIMVGIWLFTFAAMVLYEAIKGNPALLDNLGGLLIIATLLYLLANSYL